MDSIVKWNPVKIALTASGLSVHGYWPSHNDSVWLNIDFRDNYLQKFKENEHNLI